MDLGRQRLGGADSDGEIWTNKVDVVVERRSDVLGGAGDGGDNRVGVG